MESVGVFSYDDEDDYDSPERGYNDKEFHAFPQSFNISMAS